MFTVSTKLTFYISHAASLKDKRQVCRQSLDTIIRYMEEHADAELTGVEFQ
jgi:uncharacterized protein YlxP (DUF503 family)